MRYACDRNWFVGTEGQKCPVDMSRLRGPLDALSEPQDNQSSQWFKGSHFALGPSCPSLN